MNESSYEEFVVIVMTNKDLNKTKNGSVTEDDKWSSFELSYSGKVYIMIIIDSWSLGGE